MGYEVRIIADSLAPCGARLTTFEISIPKWIQAEANTHRMLSRNSASSRAIPVAKMIRRILVDPVIPVWWGKNQAGMQAEEEVSDEVKESAERIWRLAGSTAIKIVESLVEIGLHKQVANRLLEPWMFTSVIVSGTHWNNFFNLRCHKDAQPELRKVAVAMRTLWEVNEPTPLDANNRWHTPYVSLEERQQLLSEGYNFEEILHISAGRCARVSYLTHDGKRSPQEDVDLFQKLLGQGHMCYDDQTEVLTQEGWKPWSAVGPADRLFSVDPKTLAGSFELPSALHRFIVNEPVYGVCGQQLDLKVTLNHRMVVSYRKSSGAWSPFDFQLAQNVVGKPRRYLLSAYSVENNAPDIGDFPPHNFLRLMGFFIGDGHTVGGNQVSFHLKKERKIAYLYSLGIPVRAICNNKYVVDLPGVGTWFRENCYDEEGNKKIPIWVLKLSKLDVMCLLDGLRNSDGSSKRKTWVYDTTSKQVADVLQAILHMHGQSGNVSTKVYKKKSGGYGTAMRINVSAKQTTRVEPSQKSRSLTYKETIDNYDGVVYCATVSTGALMVRRNGHVSVSGNSPTEHVAYAFYKEEWEEYARESCEKWITEGIPIGNFWGFKQLRKFQTGEYEFSPTR